MSKDKELPSTTWRNALVASDLPDKTKMVGVAIASHAYDKKDWGKPSYQLLRQETNIKTDKTIRRHTKLLDDLGWLNITKQKSPAGQFNRYQLTLPVDVLPEVSSLTRGVSLPTQEPSLPVEEPSLPEPSLLETQPSLLEVQPSLLSDQPSLPQGEVEVISTEVISVNTKGEVNSQEVTSPSQGKSIRESSNSTLTLLRNKTSHYTSLDYKPGPPLEPSWEAMFQEAEARYYYFKNKWGKADLDYLQVKQFFVDWVKDEMDNTRKTTLLFLNFNNESFADLTIRGYPFRKVEDYKTFEDFETRKGFVAGDQPFPVVWEAIQSNVRYKRRGKEVILL